MTKSIYWVANKLYRMLIFGCFIRNYLELSQYILVSSINETYANNTKDSYRLISLTFAYLMIFLYILMIGFLLLLTFSSYSLNEEEHNKLEEFFKGLKIDKKNKFYVAVLLLRRLTFVIILIVLESITSRIIIAILAIIQIGYTIFVFYTRPYKETTGNVIEILNEIYFSLLIIFLIPINAESEWNSFKTNSYMWMIVSNTLVVFMIVLTFSLREP